MKRKFSFFLIATCNLLTSQTSLLANTISVTLNTDPSVSTPGTLRYALLTANSGDTISLSPGLGTIALSYPLPAITQAPLTIAADPTSPVTINGGGNFQIFSIVPSSLNAGAVSISNITVSGGLSQGGNGGAGGAGGGGGGGAAGGGGLYIHNGGQATLSAVSFQNNIAQGGNGGAGSGTGKGGGGGGGGFCSKAAANQYGNGGAGTSGGNIGSGGGGGGNLAGGNGGTDVGSSTAGNSGFPGGISGLVQSGGGGGGAAIITGGAPGNGGISYQPQNATAASLGGPGGPAGSGRNGGGGAGANSASGAGGAASGGVAAGGYGGDGGKGIGIDTFFGGGGGGGAAGQAPTNPYNGGAGWGTGGGGGASNGQAGNGGLGGGGGGGACYSPGTTTGVGGAGGFGGGGGSGEALNGTSLFGGGSGGALSGGGGAGMGGAIFVQDQATLTIQDGFSLSLNQALGGTGLSSNSGQALGQDLFLRSGGTVTVSVTGALTLSDIQGNQGVGGQAIPGAGGLIMNGSGTLTLSGNNTYTASTQIQSGTVVISSDSNLGSASNTIGIGSGTLQTTASFSSARNIALSGSGSISPNASTTLTLTGTISGSGSLSKQGSGTLVLSPASANSYTGGTTIGAGTLQIQSDSALGKSTSSITMADGSSLAVMVPAIPGFIVSNRKFILAGASTINVTTLAPDVTPTTYIIEGPITGSGSLMKTGSQTLFLLNANSYSGGTQVNDGVLAGDTTSLQGDIAIHNPGTLVFLQAASGSYAGSLTGDGTLQIGNMSATPFPLATFTGDSSSFTGPTQVLTSGVLAVNGSLSASPMTISLGGWLQGTGTVGSVDNFGTIKPGNSIGTLHVNGNVTFEIGSTFLVEVSSNAAALLAGAGSASLAGTLQLTTQTSGFFGLGGTYTILTASGGRTGTFIVNPAPNLTATVDYFPTSVVLNVTVDEPFLNFPYDNPNEESVGNNINALVAAGDLPPNSPLGQAINALAGLSNNQINEALDQMHPAPFSAFAEIQTAFGGQLASMFHRRPVPYCACNEETRFWVEPFGNWLKEKNLGYQLGFNAISRGAAVGFDTEITEGWTIGIGCAWNKTHMQWRRGQGNASIQGYYAAAYTDYASDNFYIGLTCLQGFDTCSSSRHINYSTVHEEAHATRRNRETIGQLATAVFFGPGAFFAFPYLNVDYFFLKEGKVSEHGAPGLNLEVREHSGSTLRMEAGFAVQVQDTNQAHTMCIAPLFGLGWAMEMPLNRTPYNSTFEGEPIPFNVHGWDYTWQLFTLRFGFTVTYKCASIYGGYVAEMSPLKSTPFFDQRGDIRLELSW